MMHKVPKKNLGVRESEWGQEGDEICLGGGLPPLVAPLQMVWQGQKCLY